MFLIYLCAQKPVSMRSVAAVLIVLLLNGQTLSLGCSRPEYRKQQISSSKSEHFVPINKKTVLNCHWYIMEFSEFEWI
jgi:hypothetical protein